MSAHKIVVADPIGTAGFTALREGGAEVVDATAASADDLATVLSDADALLVRSRTRVDRALLTAARRVRVVGRAGNGVDNIDLAAASERGILVVNAPSGNLLSAVEHTFALLFAVARNVPQACAALRRGRWDRKEFLGTELRGKTLGIVGLGRIGQRVAAGAAAFGLRVVAHDPYLSSPAVRRADVELLPLEELLRCSDVVSLHVPLTEETRHLLDADRLAQMRPGALVINCSRGGVVDEAALLVALQAGRLGGAGLDVFDNEPPDDLALVRHPRVVATPHLGAQTREAQERTAEEIAGMVLAALDGSLAVTAVNLPFRWSASGAEPLLRLGEQLGRLAAPLAGGSFDSMEVTLEGLDDDLRRPVTLAVARGALGRALGSSRLNYVNVEAVCEQRGVELVTRVRQGESDYPVLVSVRVAGEDREIELAGSCFDDHDPRVVRFGRIPLEFRPYGRLLVLRTLDVTGVLGRVGTILGEAAVNIADIHLARKDGETDAWTILRLDAPPGPDVFERLEALPELRLAMTVDLGPATAGPATAGAAATSERPLETSLHTTNPGRA